MRHTRLFLNNAPSKFVYPWWNALRRTESATASWFDADSSGVMAGFVFDPSGGARRGSAKTGILCTKVCRVSGTSVIFFRYTSRKRVFVSEKKCTSYLKCFYRASAHSEWRALAVEQIARCGADDRGQRILM